MLTGATLTQADLATANLARAIENSLRSVTKLRGEVTLVRPGELPNDGKVIEDAKKYG